MSTMFRKHNKRLIAGNTPLSRRDFLRFSGLALAATALPLQFTQSHSWTKPRTTWARHQTAGVLRIAWEAPVTLDPAKLSTDSEVALVNAIYDYLLDTNSQAQLQPRLAQSWSVSDDGLAYTLNLVQNAAFHDGSPFTSADVVWTFERLRDPAQSSAADFFGNIASVEAMDPYTVVFHLNSTAPDFLYNLTEDPLNLNGTGPFKVLEFDAEDRAILERNASYWLDGAPTLERLEFIYFGDVNAGVNALRDGAVDVALRMATQVFQTLRGEFTTIDIPTNGYNLVRLRHDRGPGLDPRVWKAFKLATDRQRIFDIIAAGYGAVGKDTPIGPLYADYFDASLEVAPRDPTTARQLLADAGYPDGLDFQLFVPNSGDRPDLAQAFRALWREANIRVEIQTVDEGVYYSDAPDNWLEADLGITGWGSRPTPQQYLDLQLKTGAVWNESHYSDAELDALIDLAGSSLDQEIRIQAYKDIQKLLVDRGPIIVPYFFPQFAAMQPGVDGVRVHPFAGRTDFRFATSTGA
jgi:peptide/nickel transport system substrate-binding protein